MYSQCKITPTLTLLKSHEITIEYAMKAVLYI
jgi:hypothetical protein